MITVKINQYTMSNLVRILQALTESGSGDTKMRMVQPRRKIRNMYMQFLCVPHPHLYRQGTK
jgi:hypothetical protein